MTTNKSVAVNPNVRETLAMFVEQHTAGKSGRERREVEGVMSLPDPSICGCAYLGLDKQGTTRWKLKSA